MKLSRIIFTMAAVLLTASCMKDPLPGFEGGNGSSAIEINPVTRVLTKAPVVGTTFPSGRTIVVSAYNNVQGGTSKNHFSAAAFTKDGETWKGGKYWPSSGTLDILGYSADGLTVSAAYDSNVAAGVTLTIPDNSTAQTDILWGAVTGQSSGSPVSMGLHHALAALAFNAKSTDAYNETANTGITVTGITVKGVKNSGTVYLKGDNTCTWSSLSTAKDISVPGLTDGYGVPSEEMTIGSANPFGIGNTGLVVIPQAATSVTVTYTVHKGRDAGGNAVDETGVQGTATLSGSWAAGKKYICTLSFEAEKNLELSVSVVDWTDDIQDKGISGEVSATYRVDGATKVTLPDASLTAGGVVYVDWGDGSYDTSNSTSAGTVSLAHVYAGEFTGDVSIRVLKGTLDFGKVEMAHFSAFSVNNSNTVKVQKGFFFNVGDAIVEFSTGNLYWTGSKFAFETNQYDYRTSWSTSHIDKFFWSSSASVARNSSYSDGSASTGDKFFAADGGAIEGYTVLSKDEWDYLFSHATMKFNVSVNSKKCLVLAPDGVSVTISSSYTSSAWNTAVTNYGLVALPMAGLRNGTSFADVGSLGYYWSGTPDESAYDLAYDGSFNTVYPEVGNYNRNKGQSVRLVRIVRKISQGGGSTDPDEPETPVPDHTEDSGIFTIDEYGSTVRFAPGNLLWNGSSFGFEKQQYSCPVGWDANDVGHFYFSKTASAARAKTYSDQSLQDGDVFFAADGGAVSGYTVLTSKEWEYVLTHNLVTDGEPIIEPYTDEIYGFTNISIQNTLVVLIAGMPCIVLAPDGVSHSVVDREYTATQWAAAEAQYGLVALPSAGDNLNNEVNSDYYYSCIYHCKEYKSLILFDEYVMYAGTEKGYFVMASWPGSIDYCNTSRIDVVAQTVSHPARLVKDVNRVEHPSGPTFTVNASGKKVKFSPGNLYWNGSAYKFETNQYDYPTTWSTSHVGHFYWSESASVARATSYNDPSASINDTFFAASGINVSGYSDTWTVLSADEWDYLIQHNLATDGPVDYGYEFYGQPFFDGYFVRNPLLVSIAGKYCYVLRPDGVDNSVVKTSYTTAQWTAAESLYGLVALPFAGCRVSSDISDEMDIYWSLEVTNDMNLAMAMNSSSPYYDLHKYVKALFCYSNSESPAGELINLACVDIPRTTSIYDSNIGAPVRLVSVLEDPQVPKLFTVNKYGKKVEFAPGNLYWNGSSFQFESNDYSYPTSWSTSHVGHFYWYSLASEATGLNPPNDFFYIDSYISTEHFAKNGGAIDGWTILNYSEWAYVLKNNLATNGNIDIETDFIGCGSPLSVDDDDFFVSNPKIVKIADKDCIVLVPDGISKSVVNSTYTAAQWTTAKSQYGLVALPLAGLREGSSIDLEFNYYTVSSFSGRGVFLLAIGPIDFIDDSVILGLLDINMQAIASPVRLVKVW